MTATPLLPPNASPLERDLEQSMALYDAPRDIVLERLWRPQECPEAVLPFLAWGLGVRRWDPAWPLETRREAVADAIAVHRTRGTLGAVQDALDAIGAVHDITERPNGAAFRMAIAIYNSNALLGETDPATLREYVDDAKRLSVHYDMRLTASLALSPIPVAAAVGGVQVGHFALRVDAS